MTPAEAVASLRISLPGWAVEFHGDRREYHAWRRLEGGSVIYASPSPERLVAIVRAAEGQMLVVAR